MKYIAIYKTFQYPDSLEECKSINCNICIKLKCGRNTFKKDIKDGKYKQEEIVINDYTKEEAKKLIIKYMKENKKADTEILMTKLHIDLPLLIDILDELKKEGKIIDINEDELKTEDK